MIPMNLALKIKIPIIISMINLQKDVHYWCQLGSLIIISLNCRTNLMNLGIIVIHDDN